MPVKNPEKAGLKIPVIRRKIFVGDVASMGTPEHNPEPTTDRGRRRPSKGAQPAARPQLLVGKAHRPHTTPRDIRTNMGMHMAKDDHSRYVSLVHGRRVYHD